MKQNVLYIDDVLAGGLCIYSTLRGRDEIIKALKSAGFPLRKWTSNNINILDGIPKFHRLNGDFLVFDDINTVKALGISCYFYSEYFSFATTSVDSKDILTKRLILQVITKLCIPISWLLLVIIVKQNIWPDETNYDETVLPTTIDPRQTFACGYKEINNIRTPRWVAFASTDAAESRDIAARK